jgi:hypothetical protein
MTSARPASPEGASPSCRILRIGTGYGFAIFVSPADAGPETPGVRCHRFAAWELDGHRPFKVHPINPQTAMETFAGMRNESIGGEIPPEEAFPSLEDAVAFIVEAHLAAATETLLELERSNDGRRIQSVRIEPDGAGTLWTDVVCGCGRNGLRADGEPHGNFRHRLEPGGKERILACACGALFRLRPQQGHVHIETVAEDD